MMGESNVVKSLSAIGSSGVESSIFQFCALARREPSSSALITNNYRTDRFACVQHAITVMARFPEGHELHVSLDVAERARDILGVIKETLDVRAPKIFTQDDETLVMKWADGPIERYISLTATDLAVLEKHRKSKLRCVYETEDTQRVDIAQLVSSMSARVASETAEAE